MKKDFYLGLDIGTDSVGYAVTDDRYKLLKFHGEPAWGVTLFDEASLSADRRGFRSARRRLDRRQQRVQLIQELFATEIAKVDERFYIRLQESSLFREDVGEPYTLFNENGFTDKEYYNRLTGYPTIHHLIKELMENDNPHDVRLVYLACSWLVAHRGHFLSNINKENLVDIKDFSAAYKNFLAFFEENGYRAPWECKETEAIGEILKKKISVSEKTKELANCVLAGGKAEKEGSEEFPFSQEAIIRLLAGRTCKVQDVFCNEAYADFGSVSLGMDEEKLGEIAANIGDDFELIAAMRGIADWAVLVDVLGNEATISEAKVKVYEQHKKDLAVLKYMIRTYQKDKYDEVFRDLEKDNYVAYTGHLSKPDKDNKLKRKKLEDVSAFLLKVVDKMQPSKKDEAAYQDMVSRLELRTFLPKQKNTDNRVIPNQLYWYELTSILKNAEKYLAFLGEQDSDGLSVSKKIESVFLFRVPYFVGPLNAHSSNAWIVRKAGKIYPWNFDQMVDLDASEQQFIQKMTNHCTYLPDEPVLPKDSLAYHKFMVLNELNNLRINGNRISVELKQRVYNELFLNLKRVTRKKLEDYLISIGELEKDKRDALSGIDEDIHSNLAPQIAFSRLLNGKVLTEQDVELVIERASYAEDKSRLAHWLEKNYPQISEEDRKYICKIKIKDFGRLSRRFLCAFEGANKETGEVTTILGAMWNTQNNLMELLSERFTFVDELRKYSEEYYNEKKFSLVDRLDEMYLSNAVKRSVFRTLAIVHDIKKAFGEPKKIFIEMTRGASEEQKGKRTKSRKQQILDLYAQCKDEDVRLLKKELEQMGDYADNKLQGDKLFLYYMQFGRCMYTGKRIELEKLGTKLYDIDHIYPQAYVKDDSILNNKVLVLSEANGEKSDTYPIKESIRSSQKEFWNRLKSCGMMSEEKYKRLVRATPFTEEEKYGFINRQLTETSQSTKAVAELLQEYFENTEIVYCKAKLASEFRQEFDLPKSRVYNDLHHAVDAYLNIVTGNVYHSKFTKQFNVDTRYSIKTKTLFTHPVIVNGRTIWEGEEDIARIKSTAAKNTAHFTKFATLKKGGLFDQMPVPAAEGLTPLKKGKDTAKYGGYNGSSAMFYIPTQYIAGKRKELIIMSVEMLYGPRFLQDATFAREYSFQRLEHILGKKVDDVAFPLGMRPWKVNTMLSLDGFRVCITGISGGGKTLIVQNMMQFSSDEYWKYYLKKIEKYVEKKEANPKYIYSEEFDKISQDDNIKLYDLYSDKMKNSVYNKRVNSPIDILIKGRELFCKLDITEQANVLLEIQSTFCRMTGGCNLKPIGGSPNSAATKNFSSTVSNWKKKYKDVRIVDSSPSGLWEKVSDVNLLEVL